MISNMARLIRIVPAALLLVAACASGQGALAGVPAEARDGAALFTDSAYQEAADAFRQATIAAPDDARWRYDLGLSEALSQDFESALNNLSTTAASAPDNIAGPATYNAGNVHFAMENYAEAANAYRQSLLRNPQDTDAKHNLELALKKLAEQQEGPKPDSSQDGSNPDGDQEKQDQQQQEKQDQQDQQDQQEKQDQQNQDQQNPDQQQQQEQQNQPSDSSLTREQAERILRALADEEARLRDQARRLQAIPAPGGKDW
jgi:Ca-activated chloride channel family protein